MKKIVLLALSLTLLLSCKKEEKKEIADATQEIAPFSDAVPEGAVIYEANIRQYSPEGTFAAFAKDIPKLKQLGVKILWVMPIYPIGIEKRKEGLGSYYSIKDYKAVNPEFGKLEDFKNLVKTAHENGIYVILDWVANHTAWDHAWVKEHPEYYAKDKDGKMISPFDWTDVVKLDYNNPAMRKAMVDEMKYWLTEANVDGFRCDVAAEVPTDFWDNASAELKKTKPVFMLAEAEKPELSKKAFEMAYGWESHHIMNDIAQGKKTVKDWDNYITKKDTTWEKDDFTMYFTSNHDENSWNGTEYERMGNAVETFAALTYVIPGMPLIYNGQEYDFNRRLKFFVKDSLTTTKGKMFPIYEKLGKLKNENVALNGGKNAASYKRIASSSDQNILAFEREKQGKKVIFVGNLSKANQTFSLPIEGEFTDYISGNKVVFTKEQKLTFKPWEYKILLAE
ncbi:alpha-amylase family glycosyl hydrolase [Flavobacterium sp.]|uniref:alpha-amylase family glycosyl hydrolase n=1 Tax=Flavobacterium sp. TaxID=239 RepID=UPI002B4B86DC|nr:alpha-amylase family glycosyl hydrolase [Flavobacterium sp.]HLF51639.1 alpha-amylase family glycosyl hydrolase [Flavobacterium sp.]